MKNSRKPDNNIGEKENNQKQVEEYLEKHNLEIKEQWEKLLVIFNNLPELYYVIDPITYEVLFVNNSFKEKLGKEPTGGLCYKEFYNLDQPCQFCTNEIILKDKKPYTWELYNPVLQKYLLITSQIIKWLDGREVKLEFAVDLTVRYNYEKELDLRNKINEVFLRYAGDELYDELLKFILDISKSKYGVFGYIDEKGGLVVPTMTRHIWDKCQVADKKIVYPRESWGESIWSRAIRQKKMLYSNEPSSLTPKGHVLIKRNIAVPILFGNDEVIGLLHVANKETLYDDMDLKLMQIIAYIISPMLNIRLLKDREEKKRKLAEENLRKAHNDLEIKVEERIAALYKSEKKYRQLVENVQEGICTININGSISFVNKKMVELLGYPESEIIGNSILSFVDMDQITLAKEYFERPKELFIGEHDFKFLQKNGTQKDLMLVTSPILDEDGKYSGTLACAVDITKRKKAEEALLNSEKALLKKSLDLGKRVKEINCLFRITELITYPGKSLVSILQETVDLIPPAWQYSNITCARIIFNDCEFKTSNFQKTPWVLTAKISYLGKDCGSIEVYYLKEKPELDEGPFLKEERDLLNSIGKQLGKVIDHIKAEKELDESEKRFRAIFEGAGEGIAVAEVETMKLKHVNSSFCKMLGYSESEILEKSVSDLHTQADLEHVINEFQAQAKGEKVLASDIPCLHKDGKVIYADIRSVRLTLDGKLCNVGFFADVTERIKACEALSKSLQEWQTTFDAINESICILDADKRILQANKATTDFSGKSLNEITNLNLCQIFHGSSESLPECPFNKMKDSLKRETATLQVDDKFLYVTVDPILDEDKNLIKAVHIVSDITDQKQQEEQIRQTSKLEAVGRLSGGIAHDFNNILTVILGYSEFCLLSMPDTDPSKKNLETIKKAGERASLLTNQLLAFSRKQIINPQIININSVMLNLDKMLRRVIGEDIELVTVATEDLKTIKIDPSQVDQVIMNLVVNARDAMPTGGKLTIETGNMFLDEKYCASHLGVSPGEYVMLAVTDTGCGMDKETQEKAFEPFFTTKIIGEGTGLGLATVHGIVKQNNGHIWLYSELGQGTTFKIYLPVFEGKEEVITKQKEGVGTLKGTETILLAEDEDLVRQLTVDILTKHGYKVLETRNGSEALSAAKQYQDTIHLIITDVVMPQVGGAELVRQVKEIIPKIKVLYMSGYTSNSIVHNRILEQGVAFLAKPFSGQQLALKVREVLNNVVL